MPGDKPKFRPVWVTVREYLNEKRAKASIEMTENSSEENESQEEASKKPGRFDSFKLLFQSLLSVRFLVLLLYAISCGFAISYGLGTMEYQYANLTTNHEFYDQMFSIVSSLGIVIIPLWSIVIDKLGLHVYCIILVVLATIFYGMLLIPSMPVHVVDFFVFSIVRVSVGTGISNFNVRFFDPTLFGSMTGIIWFVKQAMETRTYSITVIFYFTVDCYVLPGAKPTCGLYAEQASWELVLSEPRLDIHAPILDRLHCSDLQAPQEDSRKKQGTRRRK